MSFNHKLRERLDRLPEKELELLPKGYQIIGKILLVKLDKGLLKHRRLIGRKAMEILPYVHTVCLMKEISKDIRKPKIEVIAGCKRTQTLNKEHGCKFLLDVSDIMWSQGNKTEKMRMVKEVSPKETIVDMFSGIGYFSIPIAKHCKAMIYSMDKNPKAIEYLRKNTMLNHVESKIEVLEGDCKNFTPALGGVADRIIMGYLFETEKFLPYAIRMAKKKAVVHFHRIVKEEEIGKFGKKLEKSDKNVKIKVLKARKIKSYAPKIWHVVYDLKITKP